LVRLRVINGVVSAQEKDRSRTKVSEPGQALRPFATQQVVADNQQVHRHVLKQVPCLSEAFGRMHFPAGQRVTAEQGGQGGASLRTGSDENAELWVGG